MTPHSLHLVAASLLLAAAPARAGFTETLPGGAAMFDLGYIQSTLDQRYDDAGQRAGLIDDLERYDPGGGLQGVILAGADVRYEILAPQLRIGVLDMLSLAVAVPVVLRTRVTPDLGWRSGDYQWTLGRSFSEEDFWQWAASMGQPRPGEWQGNRYTLADLIVGGRYRFSDHLPWLGTRGLHLALQVMGALPTGTPKDPEELVASGTTSWELNFQGHLAMHLSADKTFEHSLDGRVILGLDLFYEVFFPQTYQTPRGDKNPLILTAQPYAGDTYVLDAGDFAGFALSVEVVPVKGPTFATFVSGGSLARARALPPLLTLGLDYTYTHVGQSDWQSQSALWDYSNEKQWKPGHKNALRAIAVLSFLRLGTPLQAYLSYRTLSWIPGRNSRATDVFTVGLRVPFVLW